MRKIFIALCLALFSHQTLAVTVVGIEFSEIADELVAWQGNFVSNVDGLTVDGVTGEVSSKPQNPPNAIADENAASYVMSGDGVVGSGTATLDVSFSKLSDPLNVADRNLTILLIGNDAPHLFGVSLLNGTTASSSKMFELDSFGSLEKNLVGYTEFNAVSSVSPPTTNGSTEAPPESTPTSTTWGIYALTIPLAASFSGDFTGVRLDISGYSAVPSLIGTTAVVPVPAAVWLFGSGLIGLVGVARRKK